MRYPVYKEKENDKMGEVEEGCYNEGNLIIGGDEKGNGGRGGGGRGDRGVEEGGGVIAT